MNSIDLIRTPDQRLRVFVSSTIRELADEREAVKEAVIQLRLAPVMFELGARPHPAINLYRAYLEQSHIFIGIYWQSYGYVAPGMEVSGLEDEYLLAGNKPRLIYIKTPAAEREAGLSKLLARIKNDDKVSYKYFSTADELQQLVESDLALLLTERFEVSELKLGASITQLEVAETNLPAQVTSFIGREAEIAAVKGLFQNRQTRLVTLTGPGGVGKTRLSLQIAEKLLAQVKDGIFFVPLAEAADPAMVVSKIAEVLGVREGGSQSLFDNLKGFLHDKNILLLLDNFEQVLNAATLVAGLLESGPKIKILVTSRARLNIRGENEYRVPTLQLPDLAAEGTTQQLAECESVKMFIDRVKAINPRFVLDDKCASVVAEICRRLDGLPLALELAAARSKMLPLDRLLSLLSSRLKLLTGGSRDLPERQQTLRNTLEWSVQLLEQNDRTLFARLGVFKGGFTLESAQEVCYFANQSGLDILQGIESLLNNSLIILENYDEGQPRFRMLETVREYTIEKLAEGGELEELQRRHARYFLEKINEVSPLLITREAERGLSWIDAERDNLRAALGCCFNDAALLELAPWLVVSMNSPWYRRGFLSEGRMWANRLLHNSIAQGPTLARCYALWSSGAMAMWQGDLNDALSRLEESVTLASYLESPMPIALTQLFLGTTHVNRGEDKLAFRYLQVSLDLFEQLSMPWYKAVTLVHMANASLGMGEVKNARLYLDRALPISQQIGEKWLISFIMNNYGEVSRTEGAYQNALHYYEESEALLRAMGDKGDLARLVHNLGCVAQHMGELGTAEQRFNESLSMFIKLGNQRGMAECLASIAGLWCDQGQILPAVKLLSAAQILLAATGASWWPADRVEVERNLDKLQRSMETDQFAEAWQSGKMMDLKSAIAYAQKVEN